MGEKWKALLGLSVVGAAALVLSEAGIGAWAAVLTGPAVCCFLAARSEAAEPPLEEMSGEDGGFPGAALFPDSFLALCANGTAGEVRRRLEEGACAAEADGDGTTALIFAAGNNVDPQVLRLLLASDASVGAAN